MAKRYIVFINTIRSAYSPVSLGGAALSTVKNILAIRKFEKEKINMLKSPTFIEQDVDNVLDETEDKMDFPLIRQFIAF